MNNELTKKVNEIIEWAKKSGYDSFVFGDEVYTLDEAKTNLLANAEDDIELIFDGKVDQWELTIKNCACNR